MTQIHKGNERNRAMKTDAKAKYNRSTGFIQTKRKVTRRTSTDEIRNNWIRLGLV